MEGSMSLRLLSVPLLVALLAASQVGAETPATRQEIRTFQVADLVVPIQAPGARENVQTQEESLIKLITTTIAPRTWQDKGGQGTIDYHPLNLSLVVNQTPDVQEQIVRLLASLRRLQEREVLLEARFLWVPSNFSERLGVTLARAGKGPYTLNDVELFLLMEAVQGDPRASVMQAGRMLALDKQVMRVRLGDAGGLLQGARRISANGNEVAAPARTGLDFSVRPGILSDRRAVVLETTAKLTSGSTDLAQLALDRKVVAPDGGTVVLKAWKVQREAAQENPTLAALPYVGPLFRTESRTETYDVLLLLTPRIAAGRDFEQKIQQVGHTAPAPTPMLPAPVPLAPEAAPRVFPASSAVLPEAAVPSATNPRVAKLLARYHAACAEGDRVRARRLALRIVELDPTCFGK
jgi:hypothetical protein